MVKLLAYIHDFVNDVLETENLPSDLLLNDLVRLDLNSSVIYFPVCLFIYQFADCFLCRLSPSYVVLHCLEHDWNRLASFDKHCRIYLSESKLIEDDFLLLRNILNTPDPYHDQKFPLCLWWNIISLSLMYFFILT